MEDWDFARVIGSYADAAERVKAGGLDGLEFECYGHLIDQFWSPATNKRQEEYGGSIDNRLRFGMSVFEAVRRRVGPDFLLGARLVCDEDWERGLSREEGMATARRLTGSGLIDFLNVIRGHIDSDEGLSRVIPGMGERSAPHLDFAGEVRAETRLPTFHAARIQDVATARHAIESGKLDMVGMTRAHLADPHIALKVAEGREAEIRPCVGMGYCIDSIYSGQAVCIHNPATGREETIPHVIARSDGPKKKVIVYDDNGAHPGLTAAEFVAESGAKLEIVTPERMLAPDVGGTSFPPYFRAFSRADAKVTLNLRRESIARRGNRVAGVFHDEYGQRRVEKEADMIVVEHGAIPVDDLYFALKAGSVNLGEVDYSALLAGRPQTVVNNRDGGYRLFRIGDAVASRNIHAAVYDAIRLMKDI
jgi:NADH:flavin oxidoreductase / NADH oxidase family